MSLPEWFRRAAPDSRISTKEFAALLGCSEKRLSRRIGCDAIAPGRRRDRNDSQWPIYGSLSRAASSRHYWSKAEVAAELKRLGIA